MHIRLGDLVRLLVTWVVSTIALAISGALLDDMSSQSLWAYPAVALVSGIFGLLLRPVLVAVAARVGWIMVVLAGFLGQALIIYLAIRVTPDIEATFWAAFVAAWIVAIVGTLAAWVASIGADDAFTGALSRRRISAPAITDPEVDGVLFVQADGVPYPVLQWAIAAGGVPQIRRWVTSGRYVLREWVPQLPCTTPASQLGILHGTVDRVPAFRWYDRELGRLLVANRPADAAVIEERASNGRGLLADGGVSVSNLFTGDAPRAMLTMSRVKVKRGSEEARRTLAWFLTSPPGFARGLVRSVGEVVKERWQASRQKRRHLVPRVHRGWTFAVLRAATNVLGRDLNTAILSEEMRKGTRSIYVDYVDYDEIAHHAGVFRPEALAALDGIDRVLSTLERLAEQAPRKYHIVVVSDHGQSQGTPFKDRYGEDLGTVCSNLMHASVQSVDEPVESWGRAEAVAGGVGGGSGVSGRVADRAADHVHRKADVGTAHDAESEVMVLGSGNLGLVYVPAPTRMTLEEIEARWPRLIPGIVAHPGIGFVAARDAAGHTRVFGGGGSRDLTAGTGEGNDPLAPFGDRAARLLDRAVQLAEAPELYVNSSVDPDTQDIAAFEGLVGAHGGLGGWQDSAVLLAPAEFADLVPDEPIEGADQLHRLLVSMLERCGQRTELRDQDPDVVPAES